MLHKTTVILLASAISWSCCGCTDAPSVSNSNDIVESNPEDVAIENNTTQETGTQETGTQEQETGTQETGNTETNLTVTEKSPSNASEKKAMEKATLGAGCFWCIEAVLDRINGVESVVSGYMGGDIENPTYEQICTGTTNHAEVVEVTFDPNVISFEKLMDVFWQLHDPTTLNRQGFDVGTQYRSAVFYHNDEQRKVAEASKKKWDASGTWPNPIVTEITAAEIFYPAEIYHQDYFAKNPSNRYCRANILPKFKKLGLLREGEY